MRRRHHISGQWIEAMGWPERLLWAVGAFGGTSVIAVGPYEILIGLQGKVVLAAIFLLIFWGAAYLRAKYLNEIADTPEHFLRFINPELLQDIELKGESFCISAVQFRVYVRNDFDRPISYKYEIFDSTCFGSSSHFPDESNTTIGPTNSSGRTGGRIILVPSIEHSDFAAKFRWRIRYWIRETRTFTLEGAMVVTAKFDAANGSISNITYSHLPFAKYAD